MPLLGGADVLTYRVVEEVLTAADRTATCSSVGLHFGHDSLAIQFTLVRRLSPDVVLTDIRMPDLDGIQATRLILADPATARTRIIILTTFDLDEYVYEALRAGASGFLLKDLPPGLRHRVQAVVFAYQNGLAPARRAELPPSLRAGCGQAGESTGRPEVLAASSRRLS